MRYRSRTHRQSTELYCLHRRIAQRQELVRTFAEVAPGPVQPPPAVIPMHAPTQPNTPPQEPKAA